MPDNSDAEAAKLKCIMSHSRQLWRGSERQYGGKLVDNLMQQSRADYATLQRVIDDVFEALGATDNEAALVEIERLQAAAAKQKDAADAR